MVEKPLRAVIVVDRVGHRFLGVHYEPPRNERRERGVRPIQGHADRMIVDRFDVFGRKHVGQHPRHALFELQRPFERPAHGLGRHRITVVELGVFDQVKGVGHSVVAHVVAFGEPRDHLRRAVHVFEKGVVDCPLDGSDRGIVADARVDHGHVAAAGVNENLLIAAALESRGRVRRGQTRNQDGRCGRRQQALRNRLHRSLPQRVLLRVAAVKPGQGSGVSTRPQIENS